MAPPVGGYYAWYDASQISGVADGVVLTNWPDLSGNSRDLNAHTGTPTFFKTTSAKLINGNPSVFFNTDGHMSTSGAAWSLAQPFTLFVVAQLTAVATAGMLARSDGSLYFRAASTVWQVYAGNTNWGGGTEDTTLHTFAVVFSTATTSLLRVDGTTVNSAGTGFNGLNSGNVWVGEDGASHYWTGPIGEVIIYPSALTIPQIQSVESYLTAKWSSPPGVSGTASVAFGPLTLSSTGTVSGGTVSGTAALPLGPVTLAATGTVLALLTGTAALPLGPLTLTSTGQLRLGATINLGPLTVTAVGTTVTPGPPYVRIAATDRPATTLATGDH